jgi:hypothetical protein
MATADVPVDLTREQAQRAAERELADPRYHADDPSLLDRALHWVLDQIADLLTRAGAAAPGGYQGLLLLGCLAVLAVVGIRLVTGRVRRLASAATPLFGPAPRSAAQYRQAADEYAARGAWAAAVRERLRAILRELEQRELLDARAGRTADEAAAEAGQALPDCAAELRAAARIFDDVWYGGRPATSELDARLRAVDEVVRHARPTVPVR